MTSPATTERSARLTLNSTASLALIITLLSFVAASAVYVGRKLERVDVMSESVKGFSAEVNGLRGEVQELRFDLARSGLILPTTPR